MIKLPEKKEFFQTLKYWAFFLPVALLTFACSWNPLGPNDFWAHAAVGRWIVSHGSAPHHALFLWTSQAPWIAHSWLSEVFCYLLARGHSDVVAASCALLATAVLAIIPFAILWSRWRKFGINPVLAICLFSLAPIASQERLQLRAEMFSAILFTIEILLIQTIIDPGSSKKSKMAAAATIPILGIAWVNLHGMFAFGLLYLALGLIGASISRSGLYSIKLLSLSIVAALIASGVNPYGYGIWKALLAIQSDTFKHIVEWTPLWAYPMLDYQELSYLAALTFITIGVLALSSKRRLPEILWMAASLAFIFQARRYSFFVVLTCLVALGENFQSAYRAIRPKLRFSPTPLMVNAAKALGIVMIVIWIGTIWPLGKDALLKSPIHDNLPTQQANFILANHITGNILTDYDNGDYFEWRFMGNPPIAIDSLNAYPDGVFQMCRALSAADPEALKKLNDVSVVIGRRPKLTERSFPRLYYYLHSSTDWYEVFADNGKSGPMWIRMPHGTKRTWRNPHWQVNNYMHPMPDS
jgi:hypothetical protein